MQIIQNEDTATVPLFSAEGKAMLRDRPVGQDGIKIEGDQGFQNVDVLQRLGLSGKRPSSGWSSSRAVPAGVIPFRSGVIFTQRARVEAPLSTLLPTGSSSDLLLVLSLCSHRINNAFLFAVRSKKKKLQLGVQFVPGKIIVYVGHKRSVYFDYNVHDGQWHNMAINIRGQTVTLFTSCGKRRVHADLHFKKDEVLDPHGSFLFGKISQHSVQFEGAICQFDIYPSAKAAHHYCKYLKKQCRQADTYRPNLPPLIPVLPRDPSASPSTPQPTEPSLQGLKNLTTAASTVGFGRVTAPLKTRGSGATTPTLLSTPPPRPRLTTKATKVTVAPAAPSGTKSQVPTPSPRGMGTALRVSQPTPSTHRDKSPLPTTKRAPPTSPSLVTASRKESKQETKKKTNQKPTAEPPEPPSTVQPVRRVTDNTTSSVHLVTLKQTPSRGPVPKKPSPSRRVDPSIIPLLSTRPPLGSAQPSSRARAPHNLTTPAATDAYPVFEPLGPTPFPFLLGYPGVKGDRGPQVLKPGSDGEGILNSSGGLVAVQSFLAGASQMYKAKGRSRRGAKRQELQCQELTRGASALPAPVMGGQGQSPDILILLPAAGNLPAPWSTPLCSWALQVCQAYQDPLAREVLDSEAECLIYSGICNGSRRISSSPNEILMQILEH
ncbi:hypothetical protein IHE44_0007119 [Lamprotornis superbus]|uniref:Thrombospondin-like N-terminal domain-containing protein n=1 Tax=Lamprotornis superbus TaxID=245042 RepID=A0A835TVK8_9PASS|nr:hypothetical protein IHE44_0007119 [Lamprotornis superbus]